MGRVRSAPSGRCPVVEAQQPSEASVPDHVGSRCGGAAVREEEPVNDVGALVVHLAVVVVEVLPDGAPEGGLAHGDDVMPPRTTRRVPTWMKKST